MKYISEKYIKSLGKVAKGVKDVAGAFVPGHGDRAVGKYAKSVGKQMKKDSKRLPLDRRTDLERAKTLDDGNKLVRAGTKRHAKGLAKGTVAVGAVGGVVAATKEEKK